MTAIDLCCGAGGLSLGLLQSGFEIVLGVDVWGPACEVYRRNLAVPVCRLDLADPNAADALPRVDLVAAATPCQDFSPAGRRTEGDRAHLTTSFARIVRRLRPRMFVLENVPRARSSQSYAEAVAMLVPHYGLAEAVLDASCYGVPQRRKRLVLAGLFGQDASSLERRLHENQSSVCSTVRDFTGMVEDYFYLRPARADSRAIFPADGLSPTILAEGNRPVPRHYRPKPGDATHDLSGVRALTFLEAACIQGFPAWWDWAGVRPAEAWTLVGNGMPPHLAWHVGRALWGLAVPGCR